MRRGKRRCGRLKSEHNLKLKAKTADRQESLLGKEKGGGMTANERGTKSPY